MFARRAVTAILIFCAVVLAGVQPSAADSVVVPSGQFAPLTANPYFALYGIGEGIEWVPGEGSEWIAGVDLPARAQLRTLVVYCLDNVEPNAIVRLFRLKGDGAAPEEVEVVVTGGTRSKPGTGFMADHHLQIAERVDRHTYHYFAQITLPPKPDDVRGILRVNAVEVIYDK
jgi:hypothetical protein